MSAGRAVLGFVDGYVPFVVERTVVSWHCRVPVLPDGDGALGPLEPRTARCNHPTTLIVGAVPTCDHHLRMACTLAQGGPFPLRYDALPWPVSPCRTPA